ncbi:MAG TPA: ABC-F family ATP-binding cassette domain-containing protein [Candidatus Hydrogenedentes bacterium]|nr:ABC-F family ATP-binding cassette domain-containing protein [Candidatus Hydrogenedentota bacterium]
MSLVRLENVAKSFAGKPVLEGADLRVERGEKIGLVGRNGTGKTTLLRLIMGGTEPDSGVIERMRKARCAYLAQLPDLGASDTVYDAVMRSFADLLGLERRLGEFERQMAGGDERMMARYSELQDEFTRRGGYAFRHEVKKVLHGLGFTEEDFGLRVQSLSGGQRTRLLLALVLLEDADLLLLDEPENHLDLDACEWLEGFLKECAKSFIIISHDRRLLDAVVDRIVELEGGQLRSYTGNYDFYVKQKALLREQQQKAFERQQEFVEKQQRLVERFRYKASKARMVQSRIKRLEKLERVAAPPPEAGSARFGLGDVVRSGAVVLEGEALSMAYGDLRLYENVSIQIERGERVGIIGPNGSGKTTLLRHLAGRLEGASGAVRMGHKATLGFYEQHHESLNRANDVFGEIQAARPDLRPAEIRSFMARFLFSGDDVFKPISGLSGGELSRVALAKLILSDANMLLMDEPTNHLDIASREALEGALAEFPGTLLIVSHDRALIDRLVGRLIILEDGKTTVHPGNYTRFRWWLEQQSGADTGAISESPRAAASALRIRSNKARRRDKESGKQRRKKLRQLEELEDHIRELEELIEEQEAAFARLDPSDYETAQKLKAEYDGLKIDLQAMYTEWERLSDAVAE